MPDLYEFLWTVIILLDSAVIMLLLFQYYPKFSMFWIVILLCKFIRNKVGDKDIEAA